jgi:hypothetical protein
MKKLITALIIISAQFSTKSNVINGYLRDKLILEKDIQLSHALLKEANRQKDSLQIEKKLKKLRKDYSKINKKYGETEKLLEEVRTIDPKLYERVSTLTNAEGTLTHVYVRYTTRTSSEIRYLFEGQFKAFGYTSVMQDKKNENVCVSYFGDNTINVIVCKGCDEKLVLAHEFGHALYIVPNLKEYVSFSKDPNSLSDADSHTGHSAYDPTNDMVKSIEDSFTLKYKEYMNRLENQNSIETNLASREN